MAACSWTLATSSDTQVTTSPASRRPDTSPRPKETLTAALNAATPADDKQLTVILGDLAAVAAAQRDPEAAFGYAEQALQQLAIT